MAKICYQKRRRIHLDPNNPYRTREMVYYLFHQDFRCFIRAEQKDYVLKSLVAEDSICTPPLENQGAGRQLVEHLIKRAKSTEEVMEVYQLWQKGGLPPVSSGKNILVKEAVRKRFARNLKKL